MNRVLLIPHIAAITNAVEDHLLESPFQGKQGFQLLGIAWREKYQVRSARTQEWGPGPPIGPLMGSRGETHDGGPRQRPL